MRYLGITDSHGVAVEYDEFGGERLRGSIERAEARVDALVERLSRQRAGREAA